MLMLSSEVLFELTSHFLFTTVAKITESELNRKNRAPWIAVLVLIINDHAMIIMDIITHSSEYLIDVNLYECVMRVMV